MQVVEIRLNGKRIKGVVTDIKQFESSDVHTIWIDFYTKTKKQGYRPNRLKVAQIDIYTVIGEIDKDVVLAKPEEESDGTK